MRKLIVKRPPRDRHRHRTISRSASCPQPPVSGRRHVPSPPIKVKLSTFFNAEDLLVGETDAPTINRFWILSTDLFELARRTSRSSEPCRRGRQASYQKRNWSDRSFVAGETPANSSNLLAHWNSGRFRRMVGLTRFFSPGNGASLVNGQSDPCRAWFASPFCKLTSTCHVRAKSSFSILRPALDMSTCPRCKSSRGPARRHVG